MDVLAIATGGLVIVTGFLAWFTRSLVAEAKATWMEAQDTRGEMERSRRLSVRPLLAFDPHILGGTVGVLLVRNVGGGPALDVNLSMYFDAADERRAWSERSIVPGESHQFNLPQPFLGAAFEAKDRQLTITVTGRMRDGEDRQIEIEESIDFSAWARSAIDSGERIKGRRKLPGEPAD